MANKSFFLFSIIYLIITLNLSAQDSLKAKTFYFGLTLSPDYSYRILSANTPNQQSAVNWFNNYEVPALLYSGGIDFLFQIENKVSMSLGVQYSVKGENSHSAEISNFPSLLPPGAYFTNTSYLQRDNYCRYIDLPFKIDYYFVRKKITSYILVGISTNIFLSEKVTNHWVLANGSTSTDSYESTTSYYPINPQILIGGGVNYSLNHSRIRVEPIFRISFLNAGNYTETSTFFYSLGLNCSYFFGVSK
jgi:hypothetical protein